MAKLFETDCEGALIDPAPDGGVLRSASSLRAADGSGHLRGLGSPRRRGASLLAVDQEQGGPQVQDLVRRAVMVPWRIARDLCTEDGFISVAKMAGSDRQVWHGVAVRDAIRAGVAVPWKVAREYLAVVEETKYTEEIAEERAWRDEFRARGGKELFDE